MHILFNKLTGSGGNQDQLTDTPSNENTPTDEPPSYDFSVSSPQSSTSSRHNKPEIRQNSGGILRSNLTPKTKSHSKNNVPYEPSEDQKKLLNKLSASNISPVATSTHTEYFDVLPSFQMFQSILKRDDFQFSENLAIDPPIYGDTFNSSPTPPGLSPVTSQRENNLDSMMNDVSERMNEYNLNNNEEDDNYYFDADEHDTRQQEANSANLENPRNEASDTYGHTVLDTIDKLPKLNNSPLDIQIYVTKKVPQPHLPNDIETRLKMYSSGDLVNGYIIITNTSDKPVDFGLFVVTLDGTIKTTERNPNANPMDLHKYNKVLIKKFLKMYDLNASYGYTQIPNSAGIEYDTYSKDLHDGCQIGLPNERILKPHTKYKKFFTFKFPYKLLDNNCIHDILPHILPPPSMGLDKTCFHNRGETISLNKALGYGFLNVRGTPLLTKDYGFDDISVSYTIEAKFIDKLNTKNQKDPLSQQEINDLSSDADYAISRHSQYFLRFVPDLKENIKYYNERFQYGSETFSTLGIGGKLFQNYLYLNTWRQMHELNYQIEKEINAKLSKDEYGDDIKHKNLFVSNSQATNSNLYHLNIREQSTRQKHTIEQLTDLEYQNERMIGTKTPVTVYGKKKKKILSSLVRIGELKLYARVPNNVIPYSSPKLLMRYNNENVDELRSGGKLHTLPSTPSLSDRAKLMPMSSLDSISSLSPIKTSNTNISELYNRDENDIIRSLDLLLTFNPSDSATKPPQISFIETNLVFWSYNTEYPLPIKLEYDFFYSNPSLDHSQSLDDVEFTRSNLQSLKDQVYNYIHFLQSNQTYISKASYLYLKSIKSLGIKKDTVKDYFKPITQTSNPELLNSEKGWKAKQLPNKKFQWEKSLTIPLSMINKNNINLIPSFQSCLVGRLYCLQILVKYKGSGGDQNEFADNIVKVDVPILVG